MQFLPPKTHTTHTRKPRHPAGLLGAFHTKARLLSLIHIFPMNQKAQDLMMDAPSCVEQKQLDELHIAITEKEEE